mgnify:CR=1 FL=1
MIPKIPKNVCTILVFTLCFWSTSTTAYIIKHITNAIPDNDIPIANAQSVICLIIFIKLKKEEFIERFSK